MLNLKLRPASGPILAALFLVATLLLPPLIPGYSLARDTVSEIGGLGSPLRWWFSAFLAVEVLLVAAFASALISHARSAGRSSLPGWLAASLAIAYAGLAAFPTPHPLHNLFGLVSVIGYSALLAAALSWRRDPALRGLAALSLILFVLFLAGFAGSMVATVMAIRGPARDAVALHIQGLMQRSYIYVFHIWAAAAGLALLRRRTDQAA